MVGLSAKSYLWTGLCLVLLTSCTFKKNQPDHPYPGKARVSKAFFTEKDKQGRVRLKTFLAGWAPEMSAGEYSEEILVNVNNADHVNVVFEIEENKLIGKKIMASFMNSGVDCLLRDDRKAKECRARWPNIVTFDIGSHFYYERSKDSRGRDTDVYVENTARSDWSARPFMNIVLSSVKIKDWAMALMWYGHQVDSVPDSEIEWQQNPSYFAFTIEASDQNFGSRMQGRFRFNFHEFKHKDENKFKITPYRHANARHINILHVIGKEIDGDPANPVLYAARWDTKEKHTIWLHGFPQEYEHIGKDVIAHWNDVFEKVGHGRPLDVKVSERKHGFDLRYPSIIWVSDRRLSYSAPMGIGQALADVRNGEMRWGQVTIWGGMLEELTNRSSPNATAAGAVAASMGSRPMIQLGLLEPKKLMPGARLAVPDSLLGATSFEGLRSLLTNQMRTQGQVVQSLLGANRVELAQQAGLPAEGDHSANPLAGTAESLANSKNLNEVNLRGKLESRVQALQEMLEQRKDGKSPVIDEMANGMVALGNRMALMAQQIGPMDKVYNADFIQTLIKMPKLSESLAALPTYDRRGLNEAMTSGRQVSRQEMIAMIQSRTNALPNSSAWDMDRRLFEQADAYAAGLAQGNVDKVEAVRSLVKDLLLHEVGHMLGLGHNFKENILPARGSVPHKSEKVGLYKPFSMDELEKHAHSGYKNYSTVMGYKHGLTDITMKYEDLVPGPADVLAFEYLYNQRYPILRKNSNGDEDFSFANLTKDGWILDSVQRKGEKGSVESYRPAYFPACNDITASMGTDPYCARWDRGYNASTIVKNHFESYRGNLISQLTAFTDTVKGGAYQDQEYYLWYKSLSTFSRVRVFYDYMRQKYDADFREMVASGSDEGMKRLLHFSETCKRKAAGLSSENKEQAWLMAKFSVKPELMDLCLASGQTVNELSQLLQLAGKDYTKIDYFSDFSSFGSGGEARHNFDRAYGAWKELARIPLKISALMTLTSPYPYAQMSGWVTPIQRYSREDGAYHISTLYAKEYSAAIAAGTEMNLNLGNAELDQSSSIGRAIMSMGYFLHNSWYSNDVLTVGAPFIQNIRSQTEFRYSYAVVEIEREEEDGKAIGRKFSGTIYNSYSRGPEKVPEIYIYTTDRVILRPPPGSLIMPVSAIRWFSKTGGYFYAIKLDYSDEFFDRLKTNSVRRTLNEAYQEVVKKCIQGEGDEQNGLRQFFNKDVSEDYFSGFDFPETIAERDDSQKRFLRSVQTLFDKYYDNPEHPVTKKKLFRVTPKRSTCEDAIRGQSLIVMAASVLNGYYFAELQDYLEKDQTW